MGLVVSMVMITIGALLRFAVSATAEGFNVGTAGMILMVVGAVGAVMSIVFWASWGGFGPRRSVTSVSSVSSVPVQRTVVGDRDVV